MPNVLYENGYRFYFFSDEGFEPIPVHIRRANDEAKFWLDEVLSLAYNQGFRQNQISEIRRIIESNRGRIEHKWNQYFACHHA